MDKKQQSQLNMGVILIVIGVLVLYKGIHGL